uniref:Uncharacterized protein n=1 Tax=Glossina palpalis gambiensis TaxID=67801 RepID=A0A1B0B401_9MUSC
ILCCNNWQIRTSYDVFGTFKRREIVQTNVFSDDDAILHITAVLTAKEACNAFTSAYANTGLTRNVELPKELLNIKLKNYSSVQKYVHELVMIALKVRNAGINIDDEITAFITLAELSDNLKQLVMVLGNSKREPTVHITKNLLLQNDKFNTRSSLCTKNYK